MAADDVYDALRKRPLTSFELDKLRTRYPRKAIEKRTAFAWHTIQQTLYAVAYQCLNVTAVMLEALNSTTFSQRLHDLGQGVALHGRIGCRRLLALPPGLPAGDDSAAVAAGVNALREQRDRGLASPFGSVAGSGHRLRRPGIVLRQRGRIRPGRLGIAALQLGRWVGRQRGLTGRRTCAARQWQEAERQARRGSDRSAHC